MNRRLFLGAIASAFVADPERLLWTPGRKLISIPKPRGNVLLMPEIIAVEMYRALQDQLVFARVVSREYDRTFDPDAYTLNVRKPARFIARTS